MTDQEDNALAKRPRADLMEAQDALDEIELDGKIDPIKKNRGELDFFYGLGVSYSAAIEAAKKSSISISLGTLLLSIGLAIMSKFGIENRIVISIGVSLFSLGAIVGRQIDNSMKRSDMLKDIKCKIAILALQNKVLVGNRQRLLLEENERTLSAREKELEEEFNKQVESLAHQRIEMLSQNSTYRAQIEQEVLAASAAELNRLAEKKESLQQEIEEKQLAVERLSNRDRELQFLAGMTSDPETKAEIMLALRPIQQRFEERSAARLEILKTQIGKPTGKNGNRK